MLERAGLRVLAFVVSIATLVEGQTPLGASFMYQGQLKQAGIPAAGTYDLQFKLFDATAAGNLIATTCADGVTPQEGVFTVPLDFGMSAFNGEARWLEIGVRADATAGNCNGGAYTTLATRQALTVAPYALYALNTGDGFWQANGANIHNLNGGNVGVGTSSPAHRLDVVGRMRVRQNTPATSSNTAGIWLYQQTPGEDRAFVGMKTDNQVGLYGGEGAGWGLVMDVANGNVGIGDTSPTARLDVDTSGDGSIGVSSTAYFGILGTSNDPDGYGGVFGGSGSFGGGKALWVLGDSLLSGKVGIGTTAAPGPFSPPLQVRGSGTVGAFIATTPDGTAIFGHSTGYDGVVGQTDDPTAFGMYAYGRLGASGTKSFRIDHPTDPENKYLHHYCAEAPEPLNIYSGTAVTDGEGYAEIALPGYFEEINRDFRYQLTVVDDGERQAFVLVKVIRKVRDGRFAIRSSAPNVEICWEVKATRNDAWVRAHGAPVEVEKREHERGKYQHPELYGQPAETGIHFRPAVANEEE